MAKGEVTRRLIIESAIRAYQRLGVAGTRLIDIAQEAKVDHPLIKYYFPTFESLEEAVITEILHSLRSYSLKNVPELKHDPEKMMRLYLYSTFEWAKQNPPLFSIWLYFYYQCTVHQRFRVLNDSIRMVGRERIAALICDFRRKAKLKKLPLSVLEQVAFEVQGWLTGSVILAMTESPEVHCQFAENTADSILNWIRSPTLLATNRQRARLPKKQKKPT